MRSRRACSRLAMKDRPVDFRQRDPAHGPQQRDPVLRHSTCADHNAFQAGIHALITLDLSQFSQCPERMNCRACGLRRRTEARPVMKPEQPQPSCSSRTKPLLGELMIEALTEKGFEVQCRRRRARCVVASRPRAAGRRAVHRHRSRRGHGRRGAGEACARAAAELPVVYASGGAVERIEHGSGLGVPAQAVFARPKICTLRHQGHRAHAVTSLFGQSRRSRGTVSSQWM